MMQSNNNNNNKRIKEKENGLFRESCDL